LTRLDALYQKWKYPRDALMAAAIADKAGYQPQRDVFLKNVENNWKPGDEVADISDLLTGFIREKDPLPWDAKRFDAFVTTIPDETMPFVYFAAGILLERHGEKKLGEQYLQAAATAFDGANHAVILATLELRDRMAKIGKKRGQFAPDGLAADIKKLVRARKSVQYGNTDEGMKIYNELIESRPECLVAYIERGKLHESLTNYRAAIADYEQAIKIDPNYETSHNNLGWLLAACEVDEIRDGRRALEEAQTAMNLRQTPTCIRYALLAVAQAECGDFEKALESQTRAEQLPGADQMLRKRRALFEKKQPCRRTAPSKTEPDDAPLEELEK
jgi:tetratricopeptide (TPR) repeat protein